MMKNRFRVNPPIVQSAIAGIANNDFCQQMLDFDAGMVILGGYSIDYANIQATQQVIERGRKEFLTPFDAEELKKWSENNLFLRKKNTQQIIAANVRLIKIDEISKLWLSLLVEKVDFIELNVHCRQKEILEIGGGQDIVQELKILENLLQTLHTILEPEKLGIKLRGITIKNRDKLVDLLETFEIQFLHIDAMIPGENKSDIQLINDFAKSTNIPIIGNNSVISIENVKEMLKAGAVAASLARPLIDDPKLMLKLTKQLEGKKYEY
ncbi:MAG: tRNA-dihydrouridine synthase [Candidatus Heimdallarchaeota archaeon]